MSDLPRRMAAQLRRLVGNRRMARRVDARLDFILSIEDPRVSRNGSRKVPPLKGHTLDVSTTGLALIVPAIRIGEHYLAGTDRRLFVQLDLPNGSVDLKLTPVRYESLEEDADERGYLIGAHIDEMNEADRQRFNQYVADLLSTHS
jgi:c-di-GMP-binding flagellar brake protein YcgR